MLDLDLYSRALKIQQSITNKQWVLLPGGLHIAFAALHALGKTIDGSGLDVCAIDSGTHTAAALRGIFGGKAYKRGMEYHITNSLALLMLKFETVASALPETLPFQCSTFKEALHQRDSSIGTLYAELENTYFSDVKPHEDSLEHGDLAQFFMRYLEQVEDLLQFVAAGRSSNWNSYLAASENLIKYFFAHDLLNYARLMPVFIAQMQELEEMIHLLGMRLSLGIL
jgi:hypothetical protein